MLVSILLYHPQAMHSGWFLFEGEAVGRLGVLPRRNVVLSVSVVKDLPFIRGFLLTSFLGLLQVGGSSECISMDSKFDDPTNWLANWARHPTATFSSKRTQRWKKMDGNSGIESWANTWLVLLKSNLVEHNLESCLDMNSLIVWNKSKDLCVVCVSTTPHMPLKKMNEKNTCRFVIWGRHLPDAKWALEENARGQL